MSAERFAPFYNLSREEVGGYEFQVGNRQTGFVVGQKYKVRIGAAIDPIDHCTVGAIGNFSSNLSVLTFQLELLIAIFAEEVGNRAIVFVAPDGVTSTSRTELIIAKPDLAHYPYFLAPIGVG